MMKGIVHFIDQFDAKNLRYQSLGWVLGILGTVVLIAIAGIFVCSAIKESSVKDFWTDETFGLNCAVRSNSLSHLLISGADGQGSPAPLDYIFLKLLDNIRKPLHLEWVPINVYYRLNSMGWTFVAGFGAVFLYFCYFRNKAGNYFILLLQIILLAQALAYFYFRHDDFHFAMEARPYALWNALWFCFLSLFLFFREFNGVLLVIATALALTSSGSLFQLLIFALSRLAFQSFETKEFLPALRNTILEFSLPLFIALYYSLKCPHWSYSTSPENYHGYMKEFYVFWAGKFRVTIYSILGIGMSIYYKEWRKCSVVFIAMLLLYLVSPLCHYVILSKGLFFTRRQYLYYDLTFCIFALGLSLMLPDCWEKLKSHYWQRKI